jgi:hypothetical protein
VSQHLAILKMEPELQKEISRGTLSFTQARELTRLDPKSQRKHLKAIRGGKKVRSTDIKQDADKVAAKKRSKTKEGKTRGRPALTKENAPNIFRQDLDTSIEALNNFAVEAKPKTDVREGLVLAYTKFSRSKSDATKAELKGVIKGLEWSLGIRDGF